MKALTIWQPWAALIMAGAKPWEWRGWRLPRHMIGQRIVIHAGTRKVRPAEIRDILWQIDQGDSSLAAEIAKPILLNTPPNGYLLGCGLGTAVLGTPIAALDWAAEHLAPGWDSDRIDHHQWAWPLADIESFPAPMPTRGFQCFWNWPKELLP
jgi:hypothetical protein